MTLFHRQTVEEAAILFAANAPVPGRLSREASIECIQSINNISAHLDSIQRNLVQYRVDNLQEYLNDILDIRNKLNALIIELSKGNLI